MKRTLFTLAAVLTTLALFTSVSAARAELVSSYNTLVFQFYPAEGGTADRFGQDDPLWDSLNLFITPTEDGSGANLLFKNTYADVSQSGEPGKLDYIQVRNTDPMFSGIENMWLNGERVDLNWYSDSQTNGSIEESNGLFIEFAKGNRNPQFESFEFTMLFSDGMDWDALYNAVMSNAEDALALFVHLQALDSGMSAKVLTGDAVTAPPSTATPEPATVLIVAGGLLGLGVMRRRSRLKAAQ